MFTLASCAESVGEFFGLEDRDVITFTASTDNEVSDLTRAAIEEDSRVTVFKNTQPKKPLLLSSSVTKRDVEATRGHRVTSADELTKFRVSAAIGSKNISEEDFALLTPNYFYNVKAEKNSNDIFEIERDYYWPSSSEKLWFYAYTPCDDNNVLISDQTEGGPQKVTFTVDTDVEDQIDLMTADVATTDFASASGETTKTSVALNFRHELTAIRFIIGEQWLAGSIKSIGIYNVHGKGTMTIGADDATKWAWTNKTGTQTYSATDDFVLTVDKGGLTGAVNEQFIEDENLYFLMIPQSFDDNNDAYVEVKYQDNAREYTVTAPLKGQSAWVRNTTVTYAISSHELTKLKIGSITWPSNSGEGVWNGPKTDFVAGDEVGLYVVDPDGQTIQEYYRNVKCTFDGGHWIVNHPEDYPVFKLPGYQYFFYYPYTPTPSTIYPVAGQNNTNTAATAFFSHLIDGWMPAALQNTQAKLDGQDLQVAKGIDDAQLSSTVNVTMAHQMNLAKVKLGTKSVTDTWLYPIDDNHTWSYVPDAHDVTASSNFSGNVPYLHGDTYYYYVFKPVATNVDAGTMLTALSGTDTDWSWEMKSLERGKMLSHTAESSTTAKNVMHSGELTIAQISTITASGSALSVPVSVLISANNQNTSLTQNTDFTVAFKNASNTTVDAPTVAGGYTAIFTPKGRYSGDAVSRAFTVIKAGKSISFAHAEVNKTYGNSAFTESFTNTGTGTVSYASSNTDVATVNSSTGQVTIKAAGSATITATVADNDYDHYETNTASYTLTVGKAASSVTTAPTANSLTYNGSDQYLVTSGAASGGTLQYSLDNSNWSTTRPTGKNAGSYKVYYRVVGDANHNNVNSTSVAASIGKKTVTITASAQTVTYGTAITKTTSKITSSGLVSGHSVSAVTLTQSTTNATTSGTITPSAATIKDGSNNTVTSNYSITYATGKLTINKKTVTITASAQTVNYGTAITKTTSKITSSGLLSGHSVSAITLTQSTTNATTNGTITPSAATIKDGNNNTVTSNYSITYATGKLTINKVAATLSLNNTTAVSFSASQGINSTNTGHTATYSGGTLTASTSNSSNAAVSVSGSTITVTRKNSDAFSSVTITVSVTPDGNHTAPASKSFTVSGTLITVSGATSYDVGKIICSSGHVHKTVGAVTCGGAARAMIVYVGAAGTADASSSTYKGLAVALSDASTSVQYRDVQEGTCTYSSESFSNHYAYGDMSGIANTNKMANRTGTCAGHNHAAATAAKNYGVAVPSGCSQWFLPTTGQWLRFMRTQNLTWNASSGWTWCTQGASGCTTINNMFTNAGATSAKFPLSTSSATNGSWILYWTSSEVRPTTGSWIEFESTKGIRFGGTGKAAMCRVRPFLAF